MDLEYLFHPRPVGSVGLDSAAAVATHPAALELEHYWASIRRSDGCVTRADFQPMRIPHLLPQLFIAEPAGAEWRFRLLGTGFCRRFGRDVTGLTVREVFGPGVAASADADYRAIIAAGTPRTFRIRYIDVERPDAESDAIYLPLRGATGIMMILGGVFFLDTVYRRDPIGGLTKF